MERRLSVLRINGNMPSTGSVQLCHPAGVGDEWAGRADTIMSPRWGWGRVGMGLIQLCHPAGVGDEWAGGLIQLCHPAGVGDEWARG